VDTQEFRELLTNLQDYREVSLGLIARHLHPVFQNKKVLCKAFWDPYTIRQGLVGSEAQQHGEARILRPKLPKGLKWHIKKPELDAEMKRQDCKRVDFKFCLRWHAHSVENDGALIKGVTENGNPECDHDIDCLAALVHFMVLENLDLISKEEAGMTVLGNVLKDSPSQFQESCMLALTMLQFGVLHGSPFDAQAGRPFPDPVNYPKNADDNVKAFFLLSRAMSLMPMKLKNDMWNADVDFDLAAAHSLVRILKRALRQLVEASVASILLKDLSRVKLLPQGFMCASPKKEDHMMTPAVLPAFMLPRACMGIMVKFFLEYRGEPQHFGRDVQLRFPCCAQPVEDLKSAFAFWNDLRRCVREVSEHCDVEDLPQSMELASTVLQQQQQRLGIYPSS